MGKKVPPTIKKRVISAWLEANPRSVIADELEISYGLAPLSVIILERIPFRY
jgi:hypothetical protein